MIVHNLLNQERVPFPFYMNTDLSGTLFFTLALFFCAMHVHNFVSVSLDLKLTFTLLVSFFVIIVWKQSSSETSIC